MAMTAEETARAASAGSRRVLLLDLLRLAAMVQMVQGHVIDAVLAPEFRSGTIHGAWAWLRGLTSVAFLFAAGWSFQLATLRELERHRRDRAAVASRFRRGGMLIALGYALHLPLGILAGGDSADAAALLQAAVAVDVLQCIGVCLVVLETLALVLPNRRAIELACCGLGAGVLLASPALSAFAPHGTLLPLANYLSPRGGSLFPLFPWAAHVLLGVGLCGLLLGPAERPVIAPRLLAAACALLGAAFIAGRAGAALPSDHLARLGWVLVAAALLTQLEPAARNWPPWTRRLAGETLFVYASHVLLVYGQGVGLASVLGERLPPLPAAALAVFVLVASSACALRYERAWAGLARRAATG